MPPGSPVPHELETTLAETGLIVTGACAAEPDDGLAPEWRAILLIGAHRERFWPIFSGSPEYRDGAPHPMDRWSRRVLSRIARASGTLALYPFGGPPWRPFQRWAVRAEGARPSPVAMQVSPHRGLWMSFRGALALRDALPEPAPVFGDPCAGCSAPCREACPVGAFAGGSYDVPRCTAHVKGEAGEGCRSGCLVRHACPVGNAPPEEQCRFHMAAFLRANG